MLGAILISGYEGQVDLRLHLLGEFDLRLFGSFLESLEGHGVVADIDAFGLAEFLSDVVDESLVEVVATEVAIAIAGEDFKDTITDIQDRDVEGAATEVEYGNAGVLLLFESVGKGCRCGLVDDPFHGKAGNLTGLLGCLALGIV